MKLLSLVALAASIASAQAAGMFGIKQLALVITESTLGNATIKLMPFGDSITSLPGTLAVRDPYYDEYSYLIY